MNDPEKSNNHKKLLLTGAALALGSIAYRSYKIHDGVTFDVSVWGEKTKLVFIDIIDEAKRLGGRITGELVMTEDGCVKDVVTGDETISESSIDALRMALEQPDGWSGQQT